MKVSAEKSISFQHRLFYNNYFFDLFGQASHKPTLLPTIHRTNPSKIYFLLVLFADDLSHIYHVFRVPEIPNDFNNSGGPGMEKCHVAGWYRVPVGYKLLEKISFV